MALDYIAIVSYGAYPTPTPTGARRAGLAVSMGLLNFDLPAPPGPTGNLFNIFKRGFKRMFTQWGA